MDKYIRESVSNGSVGEQAIIRSWWYEKHSAQGLLVWEYYLNGKYADAIWFCEDAVSEVEEPGQNVSKRFPLEGRSIVICEAKKDLTRELIGQALVYSVFAKHAGANVLSTVIFAENAPADMIRAAEELGLEVVIGEDIRGPGARGCGRERSSRILLLTLFG